MSVTTINDFNGARITALYNELVQKHLAGTRLMTRELNALETSLRRMPQAWTEHHLDVFLNGVCQKLVSQSITLLGFRNRPGTMNSVRAMNVGLFNEHLCEVHRARPELLTPAHLTTMLRAWPDCDYDFTTVLDFVARVTPERFTPEVLDLMKQIMSGEAKLVENDERELVDNMYLYNMTNILGYLAPHNEPAQKLLSVVSLQSNVTVLKP